MQLFTWRSFVLLLAIWILIVSAAVFTERTRRGSVATAAQVTMTSDRLLWEVIHGLRDTSAIRSIVDYTFWDDMAEFATGERDTAWAMENLDPALDSFGLDALWVLGTDGRIRYSVTKTGDDEVGPAPPFPLDTPAINALLRLPGEEGTVVREFYWFSDVLGPVTMFGSDITTTDDPAHLKPSRGYYFAAIKLDEEHALSDLKLIGAGAEAFQLTAIPPEQTPTGSEPHVFWHTMYDASGTTIGAIRVERFSPPFVALIQTSARSGLISIGLWALLGMVATGLISVLSRTQRRAENLAQQMTVQLRESNTVLEQRVAERTAELEQDIRQRTEAEERLKKRTAELERLNRVMIDRELRIVELKKKAAESDKSP